MHKIRSVLLILTVLTSGAYSTARSCACGCSVFFVGTRWMMVTSTGPRLYLQYSYLDQNENWSSSGRAPSALNTDRIVTTSFYTLGLQYMVNRDWGFMASLPLWDRYKSGLDDAGASYDVRHRSIGDMKIMGMYAGFSEDMSTAVMFGVKLPTGPFGESLLDRDTQIGTGTTDALLSAYRMDQEDRWGWYVQGVVNYPMAARDGYKPGNDFNAAIGVHYDGLVSTYSVIPIASVITSLRSRDSGAEADPANTGYSRVIFSPGVEAIMGRVLHFDVEFGLPLYSNVHGYQLLSPWLLNSTLSYQF